MNRRSVRRYSQPLSITSKCQMFVKYIHVGHDLVIQDALTVATASNHLEVMA